MRVFRGLGVWCLAGMVLFTPAAVSAQGTAAEARVERAMEAAKKLGVPDLYAFLRGMPKGADLHMHLSGAVYAETFLGDAVRQHLCVDDVEMMLVKPGADGCAKGLLPADAVLAGSTVVDKGRILNGQPLTGQALWDALVDSFSMRAFVATPAFDGHDQFFQTFGKFGAAHDPGEWLDEVATRAAAQNEQYLEIMQTPSFGHAAELGYKLGWPKDAVSSVRPQELAGLRTALLALGLKDEVKTDSAELGDAKKEFYAREHCTPKADLYREHSACAVRIHWLYQVLRAFPPQQVFAQTLLGFEVASADPDVVGINFVQPEDDRRAMADYHLQMQMLDYLHSVYPKVQITLHAGELGPGMVPPEGESFHIREAVELGHALRIGHGVDVLHETDAAGLLKEMAARHVMVEINLTSNEVILGVKGAEHPLHGYMAAGVPVALSTDDEGVSRIDLTHEYVKAVEDQGLTYVELKRMARTSLEHAFLGGESLWAAPDEFTRRKAVCGAPIGAQSEPTSGCALFLNTNEKAAEQWEMERRFVAFEEGVR